MTHARFRGEGHIDHVTTAQLERSRSVSMSFAKKQPSKRLLHPSSTSNIGANEDNRFLLSDKIIPECDGDTMLKFSDVVDEDIGHIKEKISLNLLGRLLESLPFKLVMLFFIVLNCIVIGIQTDEFLEATLGPLLYGVDHFCLTVFVVEILLKWYHDFLAFWKNGWNVLDFVIVLAAILGPSMTFLGSGNRILRSLRVFRSLRSLRSISILGGLQVIVRTIIFSFSDMANIVALLVIIMFVFAVLGVSIFGESCTTHFGSLGSAMFSLFICVTQDGWMGINEELQSCGYSIIGAIYLIVFITIGAFVFANLVVADVVANLELVISEQHMLDKKSRSEDERKEKQELVDSAPLLHSIGYQQQPFESPEFHLRTDVLESLFTLLSAIEANLLEFKQVKDQLSQIVSDIKSLTNVDELSDDHVFEFSTMATARHGDSISQASNRDPFVPVRTQVQPFRRHSLATDAVSGLIRLSHRRNVDTAQVTSLQQLMHQLRPKSSHSLRRPNGGSGVPASSSGVSEGMVTTPKHASPDRGPSQ